MYVLILLNVSFSLSCPHQDLIAIAGDCYDASITGADTTALAGLTALLAFSLGVHAMEPGIFTADKAKKAAGKKK